MLAQYVDFDHPDEARRMSVFDAGAANGSPSGRDPKRDLRRSLLAARRARTDHDRKNLDALVREALASWLREINPGTMAAYVPMFGEPGGPEMPGLVASIVPRVLLPAVLPDR